MYTPSWMSDALFVHKITFQNLHPLCSSLVECAVSLHPNCWSHPNIHEAAEGTLFAPGLNHSTMLNQFKRWKISPVSSLYFSSVLGMENCEYIGSVINCLCSCKSFWMKESLDGADRYVLTQSEIITLSFTWRRWLVYIRISSQWAVSCCSSCSALQKPHTSTCIDLLRGSFTYVKDGVIS